MVSARQFRPILIGTEYTDKNLWQKINWTWVLQRIPMFLFAIVSSYGVAHFLSLSGLPFPFDWLGGISFDIGFLGVISLADMHLKKTRSSAVLYYALNIGMSALAALFNVLSHAGGEYANIRAEDITAGSPFAVVGLLFAFFYHSVMSSALEEEAGREKKEREEQERKAALQRQQEEQDIKLEMQRKQHEAENPYVCACGKRYPKNTGLSNHKRNCPDYKAQTNGGSVQ